MGIGDDLIWLSEVQRKRQTKEIKKNIFPIGPWSAIWDNIYYIKKKFDYSCEKIHIRTNNKPPYLKRFKSKFNLYNFFFSLKRNWITEKSSRLITIIDPPLKIKYCNYNIRKAKLSLSFIEKLKSQAKLKDYKIKDKFIIINPDIKETFSDQNKKWPISKWKILIKMLNLEKDQIVRFIYSKNQTYLKGVSNIKVQNVREAMGIIDKAKLVITTEGGLHHLAASLDSMCICIMGSFISPRQTGYKKQKNIYCPQNGYPTGSLKLDKDCLISMNAISCSRISNLIKIYFI